MKNANFPAEVIKKFNPLGNTGINSLQRVSLFYSPSEDIFKRIIEQTGNLNGIPFYSEDKKTYQILILNKNQLIILSEFNNFLVKLYSKEKDQDYYGYFALNPGIKNSPFLATGISRERLYYGIQFLFVDDKTCKIQEVRNSSLEKIV